MRSVRSVERDLLQAADIIATTLRLSCVCVINGEKNFVVFSYFPCTKEPLAWSMFEPALTSSNQRLERVCHNCSRMTGSQ